jgi:hypothetical protein
VTFLGNRSQSCTDHSCKLSLQQAQQEIAALDETVGDLVMEIMDMLAAVSAFRKNKTEVSFRPRGFRTYSHSLISKICALPNHLLPPPQHSTGT